MKTFLWLGASILLTSSLLSAQQIQLQELRRIQISGGETRSLAFSPDDAFLACGGQGGDVVVYGVATRKKVFSLEASHDSIRQCLFFPDGARLAVVGHDLSIWSFPQGGLLARWPADVSRIHDPSAAISEDGAWIAYPDREKVIVRSTKDWKVAASFDCETAQRGPLRFSKSGDQLLLSDAVLWSWKEAEETWSLVGSGKEVPGFDASGLRASEQRNFAIPLRSRSPLYAFASSGDLVATAGDRDPVTLWRAGKKVVELPGNAARASSMALDPSGRWLAICAAHRVTAIDLTTGERQDLGVGHAVSAGWRRAEFLIAGSTLRRSNAETHRSSVLARLRQPSSRDGGGRSLVSSPREGEILYQAGSGGLLGPYDLRSLERGGRDRKVLDNEFLLDATWSRDGRYRLMVTVGGSLCATSPLPSTVHITGPAPVSPWVQAARTAAQKGDSARTGDFSPCLRRVTWGGPDGAVTWSCKAHGPAEIHRNRTAVFCWLRYLDDDHLLAHDGQTLTLWSAKDLVQLSRVEPYPIPNGLRRGTFRVHALEPLFAGYDPTPVFIRDALLTRDHKHIVIAGTRDVRVFALDFR